MDLREDLEQQRLEELADPAEGLHGADHDLHLGVLEQLQQQADAALDHEFEAAARGALHQTAEGDDRGLPVLPVLRVDRVFIRPVLEMNAHKVSEHLEVNL